MQRTTTNASGTPTSRGFSRRPRTARRPQRLSGGQPLDEPQHGCERPRAPRRVIERAAVDLIRRRGREILGTARRYASNLDDADDAYQRGLEILLTKAPTTGEVELVRWLKTVVKHEAF